jgi:hypothetical protein
MPKVGLASHYAAHYIAPLHRLDFASVHAKRGTGKSVRKAPHLYCVATILSGEPALKVDAELHRMLQPT